MQPTKYNPSQVQTELVNQINGKALEVYKKSLERIDTPELLIIKWHQAKDAQFIAALAVHSRRILSQVDDLRRLIYCWKRTINKDFRELLSARCFELVNAKGLDSQIIQGLAAMQKQQK